MPFPVPQPEEKNDDVGDRVVGQVAEWRLEVFLAMGIPLEDAEHLARRNDVDWHVMKRLLERGCDVDTALRIVA